MPHFQQLPRKVVPLSDIPTISLLYELNKLSPAALDAKFPATENGTKAMPSASKALNDRVCLFRGDITALAVDAIVNAANSSLLGGGGVDGAIHGAAGPGLLKECHGLEERHGRRCETGFAKITKGYKLPCKHIIHAVGPIYDYYNASNMEGELNSCYVESLKLAVNNRCKTIAFSAISTGAYRYPNDKAAAVALSAVRKFLEGDREGKIEKVIFVTFEQPVVDAYDKFLPMFFPPETDGSSVGESVSLAKKSEEQKQEAAEAEAVAAKLPTAPTSDPERAVEKQKQGQDDA